MRTIAVKRTLSDFIRNATPQEKQQTFMDVAKKATERQRATLTAFHMAVKQLDEYKKLK